VVGRKGTTTASGDLEGNIFTNQGKNYLHFEFPIWWPVRGQGHGDGATDRGKETVCILHYKRFSVLIEHKFFWPWLVTACRGCAFSANHQIMSSAKNQYELTYSMSQYHQHKTLHWKIHTVLDIYITQHLQDYYVYNLISEKLHN
jgi:hypothetical protein